MVYYYSFILQTGNKKMPFPKVRCLKSQQDVALHCANYIKFQINKHFEQNPDKPYVLGLPTGSTPIPIYEHLIGFYKNGELSFKNVMTFNMDEYYPIKKDSNQSYNYFMWDNFFSHIDIKPENVHILNGETEDVDEECKTYETLISQYPVDLFLAGVGTNGHLAFNEPGSDFSSRTRLVDLDDETIKSNSRFFESKSDVPKQAMTIGLGTLMTAKEIIVIATGISKADVVDRFINSDVIEPDTKFPISVLNYHLNASIYIDMLAANKISLSQISKYFINYVNFDVKGQRIVPKLMLAIMETDKIMFTSPHPDDDVLGCGGTMHTLTKHLKDTYNQVSIVYMTNGTGGLRDGEKSTTLRIQEAQNAVEYIGYKQPVIDSTMPFYTAVERKLSKEDVDKMTLLLNEVKPNHIFVCCDPDPKGTHIKCLNILESCIMPSSVKFVWLYKSAWQSFGSDYNMEVLVDDLTMEFKKLAIMAHRSQHQLIVNDGTTTGLQGIIDSYKKSEMYPGYYTEKFKIVTPKEFYKPLIF